MTKIINQYIIDCFEDKRFTVNSEKDGATIFKLINSISTPYMKNQTNKICFTELPITNYDKLEIEYEKLQQQYYKLQQEHYIEKNETEKNYANKLKETETIYANKLKETETIYANKLKETEKFENINSIVHKLENVVKELEENKNEKTKKLKNICKNMISKYLKARFGKWEAFEEITIDLIEIAIRNSFHIETITKELDTKYSNLIASTAISLYTEVLYPNKEFYLDNIDF